MITRVTSQTQMRAAQRNLQENMAQLAKLHEQAASLKAITRPSDDPTATAASMKVRAELRAAVQYSRNVDNGNDWLTTIDSAMSAITDIMNRVRDLTVQGANDGALSASAKEAIAVELETLRQDLFNQSNTTYLGRNVFAGNSDDGAAFNADLRFNGTSGSTVERRIGPDSTVRVDADGEAIFGTESGSVFALLDAIVGDLRIDTSISGHLAAIDDRMSVMIGQHSEIGARHAQIQRAEETLMEQSGSLEAQRSRIEDVDLSQLILDLKLQEVAYQSALAVTARVLQPTLMDFLK